MALPPMRAWSALCVAVIAPLASGVSHLVIRSHEDTAPTTLQPVPVARLSTTSDPPAFFSKPLSTGDDGSPGGSVRDEERGREEVEAALRSYVDALGATMEMDVPHEREHSVHETAQAAAGVGGSNSSAAGSNTTLTDDTLADLIDGPEASTANQHSSAFETSDDCTEYDPNNRECVATAGDIAIALCCYSVVVLLFCAPGLIRSARTRSAKELQPFSRLLAPSHAFSTPSPRLLHAFSTPSHALSRFITPLLLQAGERRRRWRRRWRRRRGARWLPAGGRPLEASRSHHGDHSSLQHGQVCNHRL